MEKEVVIVINTFDRARRFVDVANKFESEIDISENRYVVDAKSELGIYSLDLTKPLKVKIYSNNLLEIHRFNKEMKEFM